MCGVCPLLPKLLVWVRPAPDVDGASSVLVARLRSETDIDIVILLFQRLVAHREQTQLAGDELYR